MMATGARHRKLVVIERPCPGPGALDGSEPCPKASLIGARGGHALRCKECTVVRNRRAQVRAQAQMKARRKTDVDKVVEVPAPRHSNFLKALAGETPRTPIKRCLVCLGTPHLREPGREDGDGHSVCLPGMARCRCCWERYIPLPEVHAQSSLGSSAAIAVGAAQW